MADFKFEPMRSLIYVDCACEDYRPKLQRWLYKTHIPDSISQFEPYVTKYAFYPSFPMPEGADRFGYARMQLTEHHWLVSDLDPRLEIKAIAETFPWMFLYGREIFRQLLSEQDRFRQKVMREMQPASQMTQREILLFSVSFPCGGRRTLKERPHH